MNFDVLLRTITQIHTNSQGSAGQMLNQILSIRNWLFGAWIVEYEQGGEDRATYGNRLLHRLSNELSKAGIKGLSRRNLNNCRQIALAYPEFKPHKMPGGLLSDTTSLIWQTSAKSEKHEAMVQTSTPCAHPFPSLQKRSQTTETLEWRNNAWLKRLFTSLSFSHLLELSRIEKLMPRAFYELHCLKENWSIRELKRHKETLLYERAGLSKSVLLVGAWL